jgi:glutathione synthase/RimK-type ligase-like ATP-grasp enzyme
VSKPLFGREGAGILLSNNYTSYQEFEKATENLFLKDG